MTRICVTTGGRLRKEETAATAELSLTGPTKFFFRPPQTVLPLSLIEKQQFWPLWQEDEGDE